VLGDKEKQIRRERIRKATKTAMDVLKKGDRIRVTKCPGTKRTITFDHWYGDEIISKSGRGEYAASNIDRLNGEPVSFNE
jgi:hypothetical protein